MPKLRVYQLARELNRDNSEIIRELQHMGVPVTSHSNTVEDRLADALRKKLGVLAEKVAAPPPVEEVKVEAPPPAPPPPPEPVHVEAPKEVAKVEVKAEPKVETKVQEKPAPAPVEKPVEKVAAPPMAGQPPAAPTAPDPEGRAASGRAQEDDAGDCSGTAASAASVAATAASRSKTAIRSARSAPPRARATETSFRAWLPESWCRTAGAAG